MAVFFRASSVSLLLVALAGGFSTARAQEAEVIASGLDNPRGLAFGPDGNLYVVEAGRGGTSSLCLPNPTGPGDRCYGATGAVTRLVPAGGQLRVLPGLPSLAGPSGDEATGPHDIAFGFGSAFITVGSGGDPATLAPLRAAGHAFGMALHVSLQGVVTPVVDIAAHEATANPDGGVVDSNLYGMAILSDRGVFTDAAGNSLLQVDVGLNVTTLAAFPTRTVTGPGGPVDMESVPTSVVEGPDGSLYVGELTGFPFPVGDARVYRVPAAGGTPVVVADGFTNIIDIAIGPDGAAYVLEHDADGLLGPGTAGRLTRIGPFGFREELAAGELVHPGGLTIGPDHAVYVTVNSASAGTGQVVRIEQ